MVSAYINNLPLYEILFWGAGVSAFFAHALFIAWTWRQHTTVFEKLRLENALLGDVAMQDANSPTFNIGTKYQFHNASDVPIYLQLARATISIEGLVNAQAKITPTVFLVQPHSNQFIITPMIPGVERKGTLHGNVDFSVLYGPSRSKMRYVLDHEAALTIDIADDPNIPRGAHAICSIRHKNISHTRRHID